MLESIVSNCLCSGISRVPMSFDPMGDARAAAERSDLYIRFLTILKVFFGLGGVDSGAKGG